MGIADIEQQRSALQSRIPEPQLLDPIRIASGRIAVANGALNIAIGDPAAQTHHRHERNGILMDLRLGRIVLTALTTVFIRPSGRTRPYDPVEAVLTQYHAAETRRFRSLLLGVELLSIRTAVAEGRAQCVAQTIPLFPVRRITDTTLRAIKTNNNKKT